MRQKTIRETPDGEEDMTFLEATFLHRKYLHNFLNLRCGVLTNCFELASETARGNSGLNLFIQKIIPLLFMETLYFFIILMNKGNTTKICFCFVQWAQI